MIFLKTVFDTKSKKLGVLIPTSKDELYNDDGIVRYFKTSNNDNDWQTFDAHFVIVGEVPINERFTKDAISEIISVSNEDKVDFLQEMIKYC